MIAVRLTRTIPTHCLDFPAGSRFMAVYQGDLVANLLDEGGVVRVSCADVESFEEEGRGPAEEFTTETRRHGEENEAEQDAEPLQQDGSVLGCVQEALAASNQAGPQAGAAVGSLRPDGQGLHPEIVEANPGGPQADPHGTQSASDGRSDAKAWRSRAIGRMKIFGHGGVFGCRVQAKKRFTAKSQSQGGEHGHQGVTNQASQEAVREAFRSDDLVLRRSGGNDRPDRLSRTDATPQEVSTTQAQVIRSPLDAHSEDSGRDGAAAEPCPFEPNIPSGPRPSALGPRPPLDPNAELSALAQRDPAPLANRDESIRLARLVPRVIEVSPTLSAHVRERLAEFGYVLVDRDDRNYDPRKGQREFTTEARRHGEEYLRGDDCGISADAASASLALGPDRLLGPVQLVGENHMSHDDEGQESRAGLDESESRKHGAENAGCPSGSEMPGRLTTCHATECEPACSPSVPPCLRGESWNHPLARKGWRLVDGVARFGPDRPEDLPVFKSWIESLNDQGRMTNDQ